jgi:GNAT superfamily N-acetyltransferase
VEDLARAPALRAIVNAAYAEGEAGLWQPGRDRITAEQMAEVIERRELAAAHDDGDERPLGCVRITLPDAATGELALLAAARDATGRGVGRALVDFAEATARQRGATTMRLDLLVPRVGTHPAKERLHAWYSRLGYRPAGRADFAAGYPELAPWLAVPCDVIAYAKPLGSA